MGALWDSKPKRVVKTLEEIQRGLETGRKGSEGRTGQKRQKVDDISFPTPLRYQKIERAAAVAGKKEGGRGRTSSKRIEIQQKGRPRRQPQAFYQQRLLPLDWVRSSLAQM